MEMTKAQMLHGLYGSQVSRARAIGYCKKHGAHLTETTMKRHECLRKNCNHLKKHEDNPYWEERRKLKEAKKSKKQTVYVGVEYYAHSRRYY